MTIKLDPKYRLDHLTEALTESRGFVSEASRYIKKKFGYELRPNSIMTIIRHECAEDWLKELRVSLAEDCVRKSFHKAIIEGDNTCLMWAIKRYGQHVDFLEPAKEDEKKEIPGEIVEFMQHLHEKLAVPKVEIQQETLDFMEELKEKDASSRPE